MRLKSLKLSGFKSFANPTIFNFSKNITAIVGPNGCGKSNVIDAIRWVLGESSAKQLRGGAMSDVIFAGTQDKAAKSLASVELTFEHTQDEQTGIRHELNLYHELSVRRQVNKDGKSDYFINGTRCRRRDVVDIFLGTGLGARSYSVIEQGMIGRIVDSSPLQLRDFIEEGAGVSRYQARRDETQKKLIKAQENLERLNDLRSELEKQHKTLTRQAKDAQKYKQLKDTLNHIEQELAVHQLYVAKQAEQTEQVAYNELSQKMEVAQNEVNIHTAKLDKQAQKIAEQQWLKDDARDKLHDEQLKHQQAEYLLVQHNARIEQLTEKQANLSAQTKDGTVQIQTLVNQQAAENQQLAKILPKLTELKARKQTLQQKQKVLNQTWQKVYAKIDKLQNEQRTLEKQQALSEQTNDRLQQEQNRLKSRLKNWQQAWSQITEQETIQTLDASLNDHKTQLASVLRQNEDVLANVDEQQSKFNTLKAVVDKTQTALQTLEKQHATLASEYNTLHQLVFTKKQNVKTAVGDTAIGTLATPKSETALLTSLPKLSEKIELTKLGKVYADSLDNWLAMWLDVTVASKDETLLQDDTLLQLITYNQPSGDIKAVLTSVVASKSFKEVDESQFIPLNKLIKTPKLVLWQNAYFYMIDASLADISNLKSQLEDLPNGALIITNTGWLVGQFGVIHLSKFSKNTGDSHFLRQREQQRARLLELEDELTELENKIEQKQQALKTSLSRHDKLQIVLQEHHAQSVNLKQQMYEHQQAIAELSAKLDRQSADKTRLTHEQKQLKQDEQQIKQEQQQVSTRLKQLSTKLVKINKQLEDVEAERSQLRDERNQIDKEIKEIDGAYQNVNLQEQQLKISIQHSDGQTINLKDKLERFAKEQIQINESIEKLEQETIGLQDTLKVQQQTCHQQQISVDEYQAQLTELQAQHAQQREQTNQAQLVFTNMQQSFATLTTKLAIAKERVSEASNRVDILVKNMGGGVSSSSLLADFIAHGRRVNVKQQQLQQEFQRLQVQLSRMGAVNLAAMEELESVDERLAPLTAQTDDILASIEKLTDAIKTIDNKTKTLFMQTLNSVNDELAHLFAKVFGGGQASLTLIDDDNLTKADKWRAGLELMAQPKGKKNARLAVLSGGEKTLTALSLIFAIFKQHPAPFCVLDEVDAPLDDANIERFTSLIEELANDVQFVFISHNKLSMQIADELKGITMPNAGISSLVSVSLKEAEQYIEA